MTPIPSVGPKPICQGSPSSPSNSANSSSRMLVFVALLALVSALFPALSCAQLAVSVRERTGEPLGVQAIVRVTSMGRTMVATTGIGTLSTVDFDVAAGEVDIQVEAPGYETATTQANVLAGSTIRVNVALSPKGSEAGSKAPSGIVLAPQVQKELQAGLEAMKQQKYDDARKHLLKAQKMAPSSPDILYMIGVLDYSVKDFPAAKKQFETVLASYPTHERSLLMLGQIQLESNESKAAQQTLQKAVEGDPKNWKAHYLLALASASSGDFPSATAEAARAAELNPEQMAATRILIAKVLLAERKTEEAKHAFQEFIKSYPQDSAVPEAKKYLEQIDQSKQTNH